MSSTPSATELRKLQTTDLQKEVRDQQNQVAKLRLLVTLGKEKNSAKYKSAKKHLAQLKTILSEKSLEQLQSDSLATKVSAPSTPTA